MLYNDEETRKAEENFQKHLELTRSFTEEKQKIVMENMEVISAELELLQARRASLTEKELATLNKLEESLMEVLKRLNAMKNIAGQSALRQSYAYYHHIKQLAESGNAEAQEIYERLKPSYEASIKSNLSNN